jgi:hypothetical protein
MAGGCSQSNESAPQDAATGDDNQLDASGSDATTPGDAPSSDSGAESAAIDAAEGGPFDAGTDVLGTDAADATLDAPFDAVGDAPPAEDASDSSTCGSDSDPANCGRCGHGCLGGACVAAQCQPVTLFTGGGSLQGVVVDSTSVYFGDLGTSANHYTDGLVRRMPLTGEGDGGANVTPMGSATEAAVIALDPTYLYWTSNATIYRTPVGGTTPQVLASGGNYCFGAALDSTYLYCTDGVFNVVTRVPLTGIPDGGPAPVIVPANVIPGTSGIAVNANALFIAGVGTTQNGEADGVVVTAGLDGTGLHPFAIAQYAAGNVALDSTDVYWTRASPAPQHPGGVFAGPLTGLPDASAPAQIAPSVGGAINLAVDGAFVYWTDSYDVLASPRTGGGSPLTLGSTSTGQVAGLAFDASAVYWVTSDGTVMRVAKP